MKFWYIFLSFLIVSKIEILPTIKLMLAKMKWSLHQYKKDNSVNVNHLPNSMKKDSSRSYLKLYGASIYWNLWWAMNAFPIYNAASFLASLYEAFLIASLALPLAPLNAGWSFCHNRGPAWRASQMRFGPRYAFLKFSLAKSIHSFLHESKANVWLKG